MRQDLLWYALTEVPPAPITIGDLNIYYVYIALKGAIKGDRTGFLYLDTNIPQYISQNHSVNILTIDDKDNSSYTMIILKDVRNCVQIH